MRININYNNENLKRYINYLFFLVIFFLVLKKYLNFTANTIETQPQILSTVSYGLFAITLILQLFITDISKEDIYVIVLGVLLTFLTKEPSLLIYFILGIASKSIEDEKVVKYYLGINALFFITMILGNTLGILPSSSYDYYRDVGEGFRTIKRNDLGFGNPNAVFFNFMPIYVGYLYLRYDRYNWIDRIILIFATLYIYVETKSRTGLLIFFGILLFMEFIKKVDLDNCIWIKKIIQFIPIILTAVSIGIAFIFSQNLFLNKLLSNRPILWSWYLDKISLLGKISDTQQGYPLDNSYIYILVVGGIISIIIVWIILYYGLNKVADEKKYKVILVVVAFLLYGFGENILFDKALNFSFILILKNLNIQDLKFCSINK